jgi:ABC-type transport system substrate-binding protein
MESLFTTLDRILARRDYCPNSLARKTIKPSGQQVQLAETTAKDYYLLVARVLTDRGGQNRMRYCNPQVDDWIVEAERENDRAKKIELYSKIQQTVSEDLPQIYLWYPANVLIARSRVGNIQIEPSGSWYFISRLTLDTN